MFNCKCNLLCAIWLTAMIHSSCDFGTHRYITKHLPSSHAIASIKKYKEHAALLSLPASLIASVQADQILRQSQQQLCNTSLHPVKACPGVKVSCNFQAAAQTDKQNALSKLAELEVVLQQALDQRGLASEEAHRRQTHLKKKTEELSAAQQHVQQLQRQLASLQV